jgi:hypothetical protein
MKKTKLLMMAVLFAGGMQAQNADILWAPGPGVADDNEYQAASFVIDSTQSTPSNNRGMVVVSKYYEGGLANRRYFTNDQFDVNGNFLFQSRNNVQSNIDIRGISATKIVQGFTSTGRRRYFTLGYIDRSPNPYNGINVQSTNAVHCLDADMNTVWQVKLHFAALTDARATEFLRFRDMITLRDGNLLLCGYYQRASTTVRQLLVCKLNSTTGAVIWSGIYPSTPGCNVDGWSAAEAASGNIMITGTIDSCGVAPSFAGNQKLFLTRLSALGAFGAAARYRHTARFMAGYKIVRISGSAGALNSRFLIMGATESGTFAAPDRQILVFDVNENTNANASFWVGGSRTELANDFVFRNLGNNNYYLYATGYTNSFGGGPDEPYFLKLRYFAGAAPAIAVVEMNTFPNDEYDARYGVEIKKASTSKYAILTNTLIRTATQQRFYSNMLIRDSTDLTGSCIRVVDPSRAQVTPLRQTVTLTKTDALRSYDDIWEKYEVVPTKEVCGTFKVEPPTAGVLPSNVDQVLRRGNSGEAAELQTVFKGMQMYPSPASNQLMINWNGSLSANEAATVEIFSPDMKRVNMIRVTNGGVTAIPVQALASGIYFIRITNGDKIGVGRFMKE